MKRALVLSGGGSRGAYECGVWQALSELDIRLDAVYGTSIGALNAALVAQGDLDLCVHIWDTISIKQILTVEDEEDFSIDHMISRKRDIIPFLLENAKKIRMDISPLEKLLSDNIDEGRVRASGMQLGVMATRVASLSGAAMRLEDIPAGQLNDYVLASASCFPIFPMKTIGGDRFMDGGYIDNMPIDMAIEDGADEIIGADIHPQPTHPEFGCMPFLKLIHPLHDLGGFLDFNPAQLKRSRRMGYYDAMKAYGRFDGIRYTFTRVGDLKLSEPARRFALAAARFDAEIGGRSAEAALVTVIGEETPLKRLSWKETLLRGLELCALSMQFREDAIYDVDVLTKRMLNFVRGLDEGEMPGERGLSEAARGGSRMLTAYIYGAMSRDEGFAARYAKKLAETPREVAAAIYLRTMESL